MSLFSTPAKVGRTLKNIGRIRQIASVFAKHGFPEVMEQVGLGRFIPAGSRPAADETIGAPQRLRAAFEELGPTFIKFGQLLSSRGDLLPEAYAAELSHLQDRVSALPYSVIRGSVERELGKPVEQVFSSFGESPLASASIGQVHEATLLNGRRVVVKVQRPGIDTLIKTDVSVLSGLASAAEKYFPELRVLDPKVFVEEFFQVMTLELNFLVEANNLLKARQNLRDFPQVYVPEVFLEHSTERVLVIEKLDGFKLDNASNLSAQGFNCRDLAQTLAKSFLHSALKDGFFHGDLHPGNLFALPAAEEAPGGRIGLIDFGIMGHLSTRARESLIRIFVALSREDFETLCMEYAELGSSRGRTDFDSFQRAVQTSVGPYLGLPLSRINAGQVLIDATTVAARHDIRIPREWMVIFRAIYTLEGTCRRLDPEFNAVPLIESFVTPMMRAGFSWSEFSRDMTLGSRDLQYVIQGLPRQMHFLMKKLASNGYAVETRDLEADANRSHEQQMVRRLGQAFLAGMALLSGALLLTASAAFGAPLFKIVGGTLMGGAAWFAWRSRR
ncbi:MAG: AarF/ABC1/UbiB kinase family protein [Bdellovibrionales bacterium]|nr:AarF/ABC1/UbiB kinase family protein [Bdellovibrionales bacterium]